MLILSRTVGKKVIIEFDGEEVEIILLETASGSVKLGFSASKDVIIYRGELKNFSRKTGEPKEEKKLRDFGDDV